jgi:hypothetical protein
MSPSTPVGATTALATTVTSSTAPVPDTLFVVKITPVPPVAVTVLAVPVADTLAGVRTASACGLGTPIAPSPCVPVRSTLVRELTSTPAVYCTCTYYTSKGNCNVGLFIAFTKGSY